MNETRRHVSASVLACASWLLINPQSAREEEFSAILYLPIADATALYPKIIPSAPCKRRCDDALREEITKEVSLCVSKKNKQVPPRMNDAASPFPLAVVYAYLMLRCRFSHLSPSLVGGGGGGYG